jgi:hypothetical protein
MSDSNICVVCKEPITVPEEQEPTMYRIKNAPGKEKIIPQRFHDACAADHAATRMGLEKVVTN